MAERDEPSPPGRRFTRRIEDFECERCGFGVEGSGYTNHCPRCLWSKHVDVHPGDRANVCDGLMEPVAAVLEHGEPVLVHRCMRCGETRRNKAAAADDKRLVVALTAQPSETPRRRRR